MKTKPLKLNDGKPENISHSGKIMNEEKIIIKKKKKTRGINTKQNRRKHNTWME